MDIDNTFYATGTYIYIYICVSHEKIHFYMPLTLICASLLINNIQFALLSLNNTIMISMMLYLKKKKIGSYPKKWK